MVKGIFEPLISTLERSLDVRQAQHSLTATNLANADTPRFLAKEIPIKEVLGGEDTDTDLTLERTRPEHLDAQGTAGFESFPVNELPPQPWALDGNSVVLEREAARLISNSLSYSGVSQGLSRKLAILKYVASDGRI